MVTALYEASKPHNEQRFSSPSIEETVLYSVPSSRQFSISHLLFADVSLILIRVNREDAEQLQRILDIYEECFGQKINEIYYSA